MFNILQSHCIRCSLCHTRNPEFILLLCWWSLGFFTFVCACCESTLTHLLAPLKCSLQYLPAQSPLQGKLAPPLVSALSGYGWAVPSYPQLIGPQEDIWSEGSQCFRRPETHYLPSLERWSSQSDSLSQSSNQEVLRKSTKRWCCPKMIVAVETK